MTAQLSHVAASVEQAHAAVTRCRCGHDVERHRAVVIDGGSLGSRGTPATGPCVVELPPFDEEELPPWRCPCARFSPWLPR